MTEVDAGGLLPNGIPAGRIAVSGADGQLGAEVCRQLGSAAVPLIWPEFELTDHAAVRARLSDLQPRVLIHCAAYTQVDRAESEPAVCRAVNTLAVENLVASCRELDCVLVQLSTDYVFGADVQRRTPYREGDPTGPLSVYGSSKWEAEQRVRAWEKHFIVRTCGLYTRAAGGPIRGRNFVDTLRVLGPERGQLRVVHDQVCTPSYVPHVARAIRFLIGTQAFGTYHVVNGGQTSWYDFAGEIFRLAGQSVRLEPIRSDQYAAAAARPKYSVLSTAKYDALGGPQLPDWQAALAEYFADTDAG